MVPAVRDVAGARGYGGGYVPGGVAVYQGGGGRYLRPGTVFLATGCPLAGLAEYPDVPRYPD